MIHNIPKENTITRSILAELKKLGPDCWARKIECNARQGAGIPDILCCYMGRFLALEVKRPGGRMTALQADTVKAINEAGGKAVVVTCMDDVMKAIKAMGEGTNGKA